MATLDRRTISQLIDAVGAKIDLDITTNSSPDREQVKSWLTDGAIEIFKDLPTDALIDCVTSESKVGSTYEESELTAKLFRVVSVNSNGKSCTQIPRDEFNSLTLTPYKYTFDNPAFTIDRNPSGTVIKVYPERSSSFLIVNYIPYPFSYVDDDDTTGGNDSIPATLEPLLVDYGAILYREQDEEPGQFQLYLSEWKQKVQLAYQIPSSNIDGGS